MPKARTLRRARDTHRTWQASMENQEIISLGMHRELLAKIDRHVMHINAHKKNYEIDAFPHINRSQFIRMACANFLELQDHLAMLGNMNSGSTPATTPTIIAATNNNKH